VLVFILILLLLAAAAGVLGAVLEIALIIVLSVVVAVVLLGWIGLWYLKRRMRQFQRDVEVRIGHARRRREAHDVEDSAPQRQLGNGS
jgi:putative Mn2+ efflux pump MntP